MDIQAVYESIEAVYRLNTSIPHSVVEQIAGLDGYLFVHLVNAFCVQKQKQRCLVVGGLKELSLLGACSVIGSEVAAPEVVFLMTQDYHDKSFHAILKKYSMISPTLVSSLEDAAGLFSVIVFGRNIIPSQILAILEARADKSCVAIVNNFRRRAHNLQQAVAHPHTVFAQHFVGKHSTEPETATTSKLTWGKDAFLIVRRAPAEPEPPVVTEESVEEKEEEKEEEEQSVEETEEKEEKED